MMKRVHALALVALAIAAMILLAGSLSQLEFREGEPFSLEEGKPEYGEGTALSSLLSPAWRQILATVVSAIYIAGLVYLPFAIVYMILSKQARREVLRKLAPLLMILVFYLLIRSRPEAFNWVVEIPPLDLLPEPSGPVAVFDPTPPAWVLSLTSIALGLLLAVVLGVLSWRALRGRSSGGEPLEQLAQEAQQAIDALQAGADLKDTILRCYFEMSRVLSQERGITRDEDMTPREFSRRLVGVGLPQQPVQDLTHLFEGVRYGARAPDKSEEHQAIQCLTAIVDACRSMREGPVQPQRAAP